MTTDTNPAPGKIPAGFWLNASGHLVPEAQVREQDKLRDQVAHELAARAQILSDALRKFKARALADIDDLVRISAERYGANLGGRKGNVTVTTFDGKYRVSRTVAERIAFSEEIEAAKGLINACILRWSEGGNANIRVLVDRAFRTDTKGQLKTAAILDLLRVEIEDSEWQAAMEALRDSIQVTGTAIYVRVYERIGNGDQYRQVPLDIAGV